MDIALPVLNGVDATRQIVRSNPGAKVVMLSAHSSNAYVERAIEAGARGFVEKETSAEILTKAIREVVAGRIFLSPAVARRVGEAQRLPLDRNGLPNKTARRLTAREREVLQLVAEGFANKHIAADLDISIKTVEKHRHHVMDKLNIHDTATLTRYAISAGMVEGNVELTITER